jgi:hypothetical protein
MNKPLLNSSESSHFFKIPITKDQLYKSINWTSKIKNTMVKAKVVVSMRSTIYFPYYICNVCWLLRITKQCLSNVSCNIILSTILRSLKLYTIDFDTACHIQRPGSGSKKGPVEKSALGRASWSKSNLSLWRVKSEFAASSSPCQNSTHTFQVSEKCNKSRASQPLLFQQAGERRGQIRGHT